MCITFHDVLDIDECKENLSGCKHNCTNTDGSFTCSCYNNGYSLVNGKTCAGSYSVFLVVFTTKHFTSIHTDINECSIDNGDCEHQCNNIVGSYACTCYRGYKLRDDKHTCESELMCTM